MAEMPESELREIVGRIVEICNEALARGIEVRGEQIEAAIRSNLPHDFEFPDVEWEILEQEPRRETTATITDEEYAEFRRVRREAGLGINPPTARVAKFYGRILDPYNVGLDLGADDCFGPEYFAIGGSDIWVCFDDLPEATRAALWDMHIRPKKR